MDHRRFDELTRGMATATSRRRMLRGVAGGLLVIAFGARRARRAAAQETNLWPGAACVSSDQCTQYGGPQLCADNGFSEDGALNCCRVRDGLCYIDTHCCGTLTCIDGVCAGDADPVAIGDGLPLGSACTESAQCGAVAGGQVICGDNYIAADGDLNCCLTEGSACAEDVECCGQFNCVDGVCGAFAGGDLAPGAYCVATAQCSQALGPATCGVNSDGTENPVCCLIEASPCSTDLECCSGMICADNGISADGGLNCCGAAGAGCASDASCCADLFCIDGACQSL
ncbi:MAG: hypothetical protein IT337_11290 [Thermomicrobiales bacterium]|nr:hypothetical protein [Thermomicrobiales bacterium]